MSLGFTEGCIFFVAIFICKIIYGIIVSNKRSKELAEETEAAEAVLQQIISKRRKKENKNYNDITLLNNYIINLQERVQKSDKPNVDMFTLLILKVVLSFFKENIKAKDELSSIADKATIYLEVFCYVYANIRLHLSQYDELIDEALDSYLHRILDIFQTILPDKDASKIFDNRIGVYYELIDMSNPIKIDEALANYIVLASGANLSLNARLILFSNVSLFRMHIIPALNESIDRFIEMCNENDENWCLDVLQ
jgi:hypothetical protein